MYNKKEKPINSPELSTRVTGLVGLKMGKAERGMELASLLRVEGCCPISTDGETEA